MNQRNLSKIPVILGGAALTRSYVEQDLSDIYDGKVYYAKDAFEGLRLMEVVNDDQVTSPEEPSDLVSSGPISSTILQDGQRTPSHRTDELDPALYVYDGAPRSCAPAEYLPELPFYGARYHTKFDIFELYKYINLIALWRGQWQFKRPADMNNLEFSAWLDENVAPVYEKQKRDLASYFAPKVAYGYFWCNSEGNDLIIYQDDAKTERARFNFPRQRDQKRQCLSDFFIPKTEGRADVAGFHIVTAGSGISEHERSLFASGDYQNYLYAHGMGVETAEALAEYWHKMIRNELGIGAGDSEDLRLLFSAKYHGARYSFGYPACPNLEDQAILFDLLKPEEIGIELSEEFMLVPEQSTSAIIVHHESAKYFNVR